MPQLTTKQKKYLRYIITAFLLTGVVTVTGFLSFAGMLALNGTIFMAITAFFLAGGIEGEVYAQYINQSLLKLFSNHYLEDQIYSQLLDELINDHPNSAFIQDYQNLLNRIAALEHAHDDAAEADRKKARKLELKNAQRSLKWMKHDFANFMKNKATSTNYAFHDELSLLISPAKKEEKAQEIAKKRRRTRLSWILNLGAGVSAFLVGLEAAQTSIAALTAYFGLALSSAALTASIFGIAVIGAIGYTLLIHRTVSEMIQDDTLNDWRKKIAAFFSKKPQNFKQGLKYAGIALGVTALVGLSICATIATAGTWWYAAKTGAKMIPWIANIASELRAVAVVTMSITSLAFNVTRSLQSIQTLGHRLAHFSQEVRGIFKLAQLKLEKYREKENKIQFYNPFRFLVALITVPFKALSFLGHLLSMAVMADRIEGVLAACLVSILMLNEFIVDQDLLFPHCHGKDKNHKTHDHSHIDLVGKFLKYFALAPLRLFEALWDHGFSQTNEGNKEKLPPLKALKKAFFGLPSESRPLPELKLSTATLLREKENRIARAKEKNCKEYSKEPGNGIIDELQRQILSNPSVTVNATTFFAGREKSLGKSTRKVCDKFIEIANGEQYRMAAPSA